MARFGTMQAAHLDGHRRSRTMATMTRTPLPLALAAAAALAGCNQDVTLNTGQDGNVATNEPIELPPSIVHSKI